MTSLFLLIELLVLVFVFWQPVERFKPSTRRYTDAERREIWELRLFELIGRNSEEHLTLIARGLQAQRRIRKRLRQPIPRSRSLVLVDHTEHSPGFRPGQRHAVAAGALADRARPVVRKGRNLQRWAQ
jgi:hypothetical protein